MLGIIGDDDDDGDSETARWIGITTGDSSAELSEGVFGIDINGDKDRTLGVGTAASSVKGEASCKSYGFWLLLANSSRRVDGIS